jgi:hypothetical protein
LALSPREHEILSALAFLDEMSASEVLRPVVSAFLKAQADTPEVRRALEALQARRARREGKLTDIRKSRVKDSS